MAENSFLNFCNVLIVREEGKDSSKKAREQMDYLIEKMDKNKAEGCEKCPGFQKSLETLDMSEGAGIPIKETDISIG